MCLLSSLRRFCARLFLAVDLLRVPSKSPFATSALVRVSAQPSSLPSSKARLIRAFFAPLARVILTGLRAHPLRRLVVLEQLSSSPWSKASSRRGGLSRALHQLVFGGSMRRLRASLFREVGLPCLLGRHHAPGLQARQCKLLLSKHSCSAPLVGFKQG